MLNIVKVVEFVSELFNRNRNTPVSSQDAALYPEELQISRKVIACEKKLGYQFQQKSLLVEALKHRSFLSVTREARFMSNERLEFLGDAVLELVTTEYLFQQWPRKSEGQLSKMKSILVSKNVLADAAGKIELGTFVLLNYGEEKTGGRQRVSILANTFEAILGAIYLDAGFDRVRDFIHKSLLVVANTYLRSEELQNFKSELLEFCQGQGYKSPDYSTTHSTGPDHDKTFFVEVRLEDNLLGRGKGSNKKEAEQAAAENALKNIKNDPDGLFSTIFSQ